MFASPKASQTHPIQPTLPFGLQPVSNTNPRGDTELPLKEALICLIPDNSPLHFLPSFRIPGQALRTGPRMFRSKQMLDFGPRAP
ncbi:hypothetical protein CFAM422_003087 [Trichoderma lentiforme]|uniref:Uncharacterized protein n=1 Tax=Trichoderma lentiforme TaxID=1567552 RepID=A0A9P5CHQ5_9HYPO|nr:hypothetical protein CFAM422_003087 [Trichoderma lentiforme]